MLFAFRSADAKKYPFLLNVQTRAFPNTEKELARMINAGTGRHRQTHEAQEGTGLRKAPGHATGAERGAQARRVVKAHAWVKGMLPPPGDYPVTLFFDTSPFRPGIYVSAASWIVLAALILFLARRGSWIQSPKVASA